MAGRGRSVLSSLLVGLVTCVIGSVLTAAPAQADKRIDQVEDQVRSLQAEAESATEAYNEARDRFKKIERDIATIETRLKRNRSQLGTVSKTLNAVAASSYINGGIDPSLQLLLADDANAFLATASALDQVARNQNTALRQSTAIRLNLLQDELQLASRRKAAASTVKEMATAKSQAVAKLAAAEKVLANLKAAERKVYQARLAAKRAAAAAAAKADKAAFQAASAKVPARIQRAIGYAMSKLGAPYRIAAEGDTSFDCSGLVLASYKRAGISMPHSSRVQFRTTKRISRSQLRPGDLVFFFGRRAAHVGMYIGNNRFVHASNPREDVRVTSLDDPWYAARYSGAGRVLGG